MNQTYKNDPFFQFPLTSKITTMGEVQLPMFFLDASNLIAVFRADAEGVDKLLQGTGLSSALSLAGKPLVFISLYEYRESTVGPYNEVGIALPVIPDGMKRPNSELRDLLSGTDESVIGWHIINLPVNTKEADAAGKEIWGYPKFVAEIPFRLNNRDFLCEVKDPKGGNIMSLGGKLNLGVKSVALSGVTYSHLNNQLLRSSVNARGNYKAYFAHQLKLTIGVSQHIMAKNLRRLGLENSRPVMALACQNFQSRLSDVAVIS
ncbi:acetoacetate decarboxylase family protein [Alkalimarinus sediminis]|uniref:Acetoacetate decarboxylase family protein n=1 Tax=Alkalimarinus sediminis TaxID=1632866 RepID=A0A9E8HK74_9ALTE|nr:acetoacetate decarboxylase family protein [Alkalimarinus sediminis]UZW75939.1 acetoacetate decarboxylase family protein [Alkalimarinus sediminis]